MPPVAKLPPVIVAVALTNPPVKILAPVTLPPALAVPPVAKLPPVIVAVALITPVTYSPVGAQTTTLLTPLTLAVMLPSELTTVMFDVPLLMLLTLVIIPLNNAPLPKM